jgi:putative FmdB family regulatory protein
MPIYEYACEACGKRSTALLATWSAPDPPCPHCGSVKVRRLVSTFATTRSEGDSGSDLSDFGEDAYGDDDDFGGGDSDFGDDDY